MIWRINFSMFPNNFVKKKDRTLHLHKLRISVYILPLLSADIVQTFHLLVLFAVMILKNKIFVKHVYC